MIALRQIGKQQGISLICSKLHMNVFHLEVSVFFIPHHAVLRFVLFLLRSKSNVAILAEP